MDYCAGDQSFAFVVFATLSGCLLLLHQFIPFKFRHWPNVLEIPVGFCMCKEKIRKNAQSCVFIMLLIILKINLTHHLFKQGILCLITLIQCLQNYVLNKTLIDFGRYCIACLLEAFQHKSHLSLRCSRAGWAVKLLTFQVKRGSS